MHKKTTIMALINKGMGFVSIMDDTKDLNKTQKYKYNIILNILLKLILFT